MKIGLQKDTQYVKFLIPWYHILKRDIIVKQRLIIKGWYHNIYNYMKYIIKESQYSRTKQMILDSFEEIGITKTIKKFKLSPQALDKLFTGGISEIEEFDDYGKCSIHEDLIVAFFIVRSLNDYVVEFKGKSYNFDFDSDPHTGARMIDITDLSYGDKISVYATPFWEGYCDLPIDVAYYIGIDNDFEPREVLQLNNNLNPEDIKTFSDLTDWFNNEYPKIILNFLDQYWEGFRV